VSIILKIELNFFYKKFYHLYYHYFQLELTIAQQQLEIQQLNQKMASDEAVVNRAINWLQEKIQIQLWESQQQLLEIQRLNDKLASRDAAARHSISSLEVELEQMTNQVYC